MKYFFILGNHPTLSVAEISAVFAERRFTPQSCLATTGQAQKEKNIKGELVNRNVFILETEKEIDARNLIKTIGGTIKIGEVLEEVDTNEETIIKKCVEIIEKEKKDKIKFGISFYGEEKIDNRKMAMEIKEDLDEIGIRAKWVNSRHEEKPLSSVAVEKNKLIDRGIEIVITKNDRGNYLIGKTLAVQPFEALSFRDYQRPARDDKSGMIPPKLAQITLNLAGLKNPLSPPLRRGENIMNRSRLGGRDDNLSVSKIIYDPFCGSGTILTEAVLMGYKTIIGSDISPKAVGDAQKNLKWIVNEYKLGKINANIFLYDSRKISQYLKKPIIDAIVTEPYLGPQRGKFDINKIKKELERLYADSLKEFEKILKPGGRIVMLWPIFTLRRPTRTSTQNHAENLIRINPKIDGYEIINPLPENLKKNKNIKLTNRNTIIYGRPGQRVWREVVVLEIK